jgi:hypothetical protein
MPRSLALLSASELLYRDLFSVVFITNTAESDFWYTHGIAGELPALLSRAQIGWDHLERRQAR